MDDARPLELPPSRMGAQDRYVSKATLDGLGFRATRRAIDRVHYEPGTLDGNRLTLTAYLVLRSAPEGPDNLPED